MTDKQFSQQDLSDGWQSRGQGQYSVRSMARSYNDLGIVCRKMGRWDRACLISPELGLPHVDSVLEAPEEVPRSEEAT